MLRYSKHSGPFFSNLLSAYRTIDIFLDSHPADRLASGKEWCGLVIHIMRPHLERSRNDRDTDLKGMPA